MREREREGEPSLVTGRDADARAELCFAGALLLLLCIERRCLAIQGENFFFSFRDLKVFCSDAGLGKGLVGNVGGK